jgi:hypothetical protein
MMKKTILLALLALALLPACAFAAGSDFQIGVSALYPDTVFGSDAGPFVVEAISPGIEMRYRFFHILQLGANATYLAPFMKDADISHTILASLDAGLCLDLAILRIGAGVGITSVAYLDQGEPEGMYNVKLAADLQLGKFSLGLEGLSLIDPVDTPKVGDVLDKMMLAATFLYKL